MTEEQEPSVPVEPSPNFNEGLNQLERAEKAVKDMNDAHDRFEKLVKRQEIAAVKSTLGGKAAISKPEVVEESPEEYSKRVMANDI